MHLKRYSLRNFRRLENVEINLEEDETIFVGANNSGKTSATTAFKLFISKHCDFKIYDFPSPLISKFDDFGNSDFKPDIDYESSLPAIELDLWFSVSSSVYGRIAYLLPSINNEYSEVGIRLRFCVNQPEDLHKAYCLMYPQNRDDQTENTRKPLSYFLSQGNKLKTFFGLQYFMLEQTSSTAESTGLIQHIMDPTDGKRTIDSLLHVDFVEAQRNIDDNDSSKSKRLSDVFASYYSCNLEKQTYDNESIRVIEKSNSDLTKHYAEQFLPLIRVIKSLGFPALNDRSLHIISNLNPEQALSGNTAITYIEDGTNHELPEGYNGLGYKNLIYIAVQIANFQLQWAQMGENRPLCQLVFIEEPEVHLHAQVQQTFIRQIRKVLKEIEVSLGDPGYSQQIVVTTHSSHIIAEADFQCIRYFRRTKTIYPTKASALTASQVISLANFNPNSDESNNLEFLRKYIKLTHCDLFFADAAIIVEGTVERLLLPLMIQKGAVELESVYLTILELGGAYAHRFISLLEFINLPTLIITDLDSVDPDTNHSICRADKPTAVTSNASIKELTKKNLITDLLKLQDNEKSSSNGYFRRFLSFQQPVPVPDYGNEQKMTPRTFEEAFIYENITKIRNDNINALIKLPKQMNFESDYELIFDKVQSKDYKKVEFALAQIDTTENWKTPSYIIEGLQWLKKTIIESINETEVECSEANPPSDCNVAS